MSSSADQAAAVLHAELAELDRRGMVLTFRDDPVEGNPESSLGEAEVLALVREIVSLKKSVGQLTAAPAPGLNGGMSELVMCQTHGATPHKESDACLWPHLVAPSGRIPSMSAAETLDPREAI